MLKQAQKHQFQYHNLCLNQFLLNCHKLSLNLHHSAKRSQLLIANHKLKVQVVQTRNQLLIQQLQQAQLLQKLQAKMMKNLFWTKTFQKQNYLLILLKTTKQNWQTQLLRLKFKRLLQPFKKKSLSQRHWSRHQQQTQLTQNSVSVLVMPSITWWLSWQMLVSMETLQWMALQLSLQTLTLRLVRLRFIQELEQTQTIMFQFTIHWKWQMTVQIWILSTLFPMLILQHQPLGIFRRWVLDILSIIQEHQHKRCLL